MVVGRSAPARYEADTTAHCTLHTAKCTLHTAHCRHSLSLQALRQRQSTFLGKSYFSLFIFLVTFFMWHFFVLQKLCFLPKYYFHFSASLTQLTHECKWWWRIAAMLCTYILNIVHIHLKYCAHTSYILYKHILNIVHTQYVIHLNLSETSASVNFKSNLW